MFPKVLGNPRISVGTPASLPTTVYESRTGRLYVLNTATFTNADAADRYEWQYSLDGGSNWVDTTVGGVGGINDAFGNPPPDYNNTSAVRWRHVNDYFGYISAWSSQINDGVYDSGGETALRAAFVAASPSPSISASFNTSTELFTLTINNRPTSLTSQTYWNSRLQVTVPYINGFTYEEVVVNASLNASSVTIDFTSRPYPDSWPYNITAIWQVGWPNNDYLNMLTRTDGSVTII